MLGFRTKSALLVYSLESLTGIGELVACARLDKVIKEFTEDYIINLDEQSQVDFPNTKDSKGRFNADMDDPFTCRPGSVLHKSHLDYHNVSMCAKFS